MIEKFLDIIFPKTCLDCGKQGEGYICSSCFLKYKNKIHIRKVLNCNYNWLIYIDNYRDEFRKKILNFKFYNKPYYAEYFSEIFIKNKNLLGYFLEFDYIIPVPMKLNKKLFRGYNQTELISKKISEKLFVEYNKLLERTKNNKTQSLLNKKERIKNVKGVFKIKEKNLMNKKIILLDDIFTTGATINECCRILKKAHVKEIAVFVIAKS